MKKSVLGIASVLAFIAAAVPAYADPIRQALDFLFIRIPAEAGSSDLFIIVMKLLIAIIVFSLFHIGLKRVFHDNTKPAAVIAVALSIIAVIGIPSEFLLALFNTYALIVSIAFIAAPAIGGLMLNHYVLKGKGKTMLFLQAMTYFLVAYIIGALVSSLAGANPTYLTFYGYVSWGILICVVLGIIKLVGFFTGGGGAAEDALPAPSKGGTVLSATQLTGLETQLAKATEALQQSEQQRASSLIEELKKLREALLVLNSVGDQIERAGVK